jgi:DNA-nicking Smr family endonuclease
MFRRLSADERALWRKVVATVRPLDGRAPPAPEAASEPAAPARPRPVPVAKAASRKAQPGTTLDASWDRRLARGAVQPDAFLDLHGHNLDTAWRLLDERLEAAIGRGDRLFLLVTGKAPSAGRQGSGRGAIRAAIGDWLAASRHAGEIAAVRNAHPRHGGAGALYIILRRPRPAPTE